LPHRFLAEGAQFALKSDSDLSHLRRPPGLRDGRPAPTEAFRMFNASLRVKKSTLVRKNSP
jgi:hypothetical protein